MNWSITKTKFSIRVYLMVTFSCMVNMVSGHIAVMSMKHFIIASKVGLVCAVGFALTSLITNKLLQNKFYLAGYVFLATGIIDFLIMHFTFEINSKKQLFMDWFQELILIL